MPANWSDLVPAEKRAWSIEFVGARRGWSTRKARAQSLLAARRLSTLEPSTSRTLPAGSQNGHAGSTEGDLRPGGNGSRTLERRRHKRVPVLGRAQISHEGQAITADLVNVSQGGLHFVTSDVLPVLGHGDSFDTPLLLEDEVSKAQVSLDVSASVAWQRELGPGAQLGVVFAALEDGQAEQLQRFLVRVGAEPGV